MSDGSLLVHVVRKAVGESISQCVHLGVCPRPLLGLSGGLNTDGFSADSVHAVS